MPLRPYSRGLSRYRREPVRGAVKKMGLPWDAYYVLTRAEARLTNSKIHPNSGAPDYDIEHNVSDLVGDTDDLTEGSTNLYYTDARVETKGDTLYLKLDGSNANTTIDIGSEDLTTLGDISCAALTASDLITGSNGAFIETDTGGAGTVPFTAKRTRTAVTWASGVASFVCKAATNMSDGFGAAFDFTIEDDTSGEQNIASFGASRSGADNSGRLFFTVRNAGAAVQVFTCDKTGYAGVGIGDAEPLSRFEIKTVWMEGRQALTINQDDADKAFIDYQGVPRADYTTNICTTWEVATIAGFVKVEVIGGEHWMPYYDLTEAP